MFERWRYQGRHRGIFLDRYRDPEGWAAAERWSLASLAAINAEQWAHRVPVVTEVLIRDYNPELRVAPMLDDAGQPIWAPSRPLSMWELEAEAQRLEAAGWQLNRYAMRIEVPTVDDEELAHQARLMGMRGA